MSAASNPWSRAKCPSFDQLQILAAGQAEPTTAQQLSEHLDTCDTCRRRYEQLRSAVTVRDPDSTHDDHATQAQEFAPDELKTAPGDSDAAAADSTSAFDSDAVAQWRYTRSQIFGELPTRFGRYELRRLLGEGAMGEVYLAWDTQLGREVALKVPTTLARPKNVQRFLREAQSAAVLDHPFICPVYDYGQINGIRYLTLKYIAGRTLADVLADGPMPLRDAVKLCGQVAEALHAAHRSGVVHRDLKPGNIMLDETGRPYVMDFGLARRDSADASLTRTGEVFGTPAYMPPEQARGDSVRVGPRSDVYSLGAMLFQMITGRLPFMGSAAEVFSQILREPAPAPSQVHAGVPACLDEICLRAMAKDPDDRYATAADFAAALDACTPELLQAAPAKNGERKTLSYRNAVLACAGVGVVTIVLLLGSWPWSDQSGTTLPIRDTLEAKQANGADVVPSTDIPAPRAEAPPAAAPDNAAAQAVAAVAKTPAQRFQQSFTQAIRQLAVDLKRALENDPEGTQITVGSFTPADADSPRVLGQYIKSQLYEELKQAGLEPKLLGTKFSCKGEYMYLPEDRKLQIETTLRSGPRKVKTVTVDLDDLTASDLATLGQVRPKLHILVLAADAYPEMFLMPWPLKDAEALVNDLRRQTTAVYDVGKTYWFVNEEIAAESLPAQINTICEELKAEATPRDLLVAFIAGHAVTHEGRYYFIPPHAELTRENISDARDSGLYPRIGVPWSTLAELRKAPCRTFVLLDTSNAGTAVEELDQTQGEQKQNSDEQIFVVLGAARADQDSVGDSVQGSFFMQSVREALAGRADEGGSLNNSVDLRELTSYVLREVPLRMRAIKTQVPVMWPASISDEWNFPLTAKETAQGNHSSAAERWLYWGGLVLTELRQRQGAVHDDQLAQDSRHNLKRPRQRRKDVPLGSGANRVEKE